MQPAANSSRDLPESQAASASRSLSGLRSAAEMPSASGPRQLQPEVGLRARLLALRDRLVSSPAFQRWALAFPLTRPLARRYAVRLFDLSAGFVYSQLLLAAVRLQVFSLLKEGPLALPQIAQRCQLDEEAAERLLEGCTALGLLEHRSDYRHRRTHYGLGMLGAALLANPGAIAMIEHHTRLYQDMADPLALLRTRGPAREMARYWAYATSSDPALLQADAVGDYCALMAASQPMVAQEILASVDLSHVQSLLDLGGGEGVFLGEAASRYPHLQLRLMDLPAVAARATARFHELGLALRAKVVPGSFLTDPIPAGCDMVSLIRVVHDHDDAVVARLLARVHASMQPGAQLLLAEPMAATRGAIPVADAYFAMYLWAMGSGRARRPDELVAMLEHAGFVRVRLLPSAMPLQVRIILAERGNRSYPTGGS